MADGRVEIAVEVDGKGVTVLNKNLNQLEKNSNRAGASIKDLVTSVGLVKVASAAFNVLNNSLDAAISRFDTMQKFPKVMKALGFSAEDSQRSINKLSDGIDGLPTKLDDVVASTQQMTAITGDLDKSTDTVLALNNAFLASGASTEDATRGMQQYNQMISTGTVDLESWRTLQETMPLALQKTAEAMGFVGKSAQQDLYKALKEGTVTFDEFQDKLIELGTGTGMLAELAKENSLGIATSFGNLSNAVAKNVANMITKFDEITQKLTGKTIAQNIDSLKGIINSFGASVVESMDKIIPVIEKITEFVRQNVTAFKILGGIVVSVATGFIAFNATVGIMNSVTKAINGVKKSFELMRLAMLGNPFALIVAAIAALVAGLMYLYRTNENVRKSIDNLIGKAKELIDKFLESESVTKIFTEGLKVISSIGDKVASVISGLGDSAIESAESIDWLGIATKAIQTAVLALLGPIGLIIKAFELFAKTLGGGSVEDGIDSVMESFSNLANDIKKYGPQLGTDFGTALEGILTAIASALPGIISGGLEVISGFVTGIAQGLPLLALAAVQLIESFTNSMIMLIPTIVLSATSIITAFLGALTTALPSIIVAGATLINALLQGITEQIPMLVANMAMLITTWLISLNAYMPMILQAGLSLLITFLQGIANNIGQVAQQALNIILNFAQVIAQNMPTIVNTAVNIMVNFTNALASRMPDIVASAVTLIVNFVNGIANNLDSIINAAVNLIVKFLEGIARKMPDIVNAAMDLVDALVRGVVQAQGRLMDAAINMINGFANNIRGRQGEVRDAALNLLDAIIGVFVPDSLYDTGKNIIQGLINGIGSMVSSVTSTVSEIAGNIKNTITGALGIHSPSRWMRDYVGKFIPQGVAVGIEADAKTAYSAMNKLSNGLMKSITPEIALGTLRIGGASVGSQIVNNTYNNQRIFDIERLAKLLNNQPIQVVSQLDGDIVGDNVDRRFGKTMNRRLYTNGG
ncbi:tape measure protein [Enterococcus faecium]